MSCSTLNRLQGAVLLIYLLTLLISAFVQLWGMRVTSETHTHHHHILYWIVPLAQRLCLCQQQPDSLSQAFGLRVRTLVRTDGHTKKEAAQWNTDLCTSLWPIYQNSISALWFLTAELPVEVEADWWSCWRRSFFPLKHCCSLPVGISSAAKPGGGFSGDWSSPLFCPPCPLQGCRDPPDTCRIRSMSNCSAGQSRSLTWTFLLLVKYYI